MPGVKTTGFAQGLFEISSTKKERLGTLRVEPDGRVFAYAKAGSTALAAGKLNVSSAPSATSTDETVATSAAVGDYSLSVTFGGAKTANLYADGYLWINDDTGEGHVYRVKNHAAGTTAVVINLEDPIRVAVTAGSGTASCYPNPQDGVVVLPAATAAAVGAPAGFAPTVVTASYYFWHLVKGPTAALVSGTVVLGNEVYGDFTASTGVEGAVIPGSTLAMQIIGGCVGVCLVVNATTEYSFINARISGY